MLQALVCVYQYTHHATSCQEFLKMKVGGAASLTCKYKQINKLMNIYIHIYIHTHIFVFVHSTYIYICIKMHTIYNIL